MNQNTSLGSLSILGKTALGSSISVLDTLALRSGASIRRPVELASYLSLRSFTRAGSGRSTGFPLLALRPLVQFYLSTWLFASDPRMSDEDRPLISIVASWPLIFAAFGFRGLCGFCLQHLGVKLPSCGVTRSCVFLLVLLTNVT